MLGGSLQGEGRGARGEGLSAHPEKGITVLGCARHTPGHGGDIFRIFLTNPPPTARPGNTKTGRPPPKTLTEKSCQPLGLCGLRNLGNTWYNLSLSVNSPLHPGSFMNSALQCLSNTQPLVEYFLSGRYLADINVTNPLGMQGKMAESFGTLIYHMWSGRYRAIAPQEFKAAVAHFAPQFSGFAQHDSQELMAFLLDGLHEDLNRIAHKPYIELKEANHRPDYEVAAEAWAIHKRRNDSVIVDLFQGQFKSTLICPKCAKISVTFDPFMFLSLPLPRLRTRAVQVTFVSGVDAPEVYEVQVSILSRAKELLSAIAQGKNVSLGSLYLAGVFRGKIIHNFEPRTMLASISRNEDLYVYHVDEPEEASSVIQILTCEKRWHVSGSGGVFSVHKRPVRFGYPLFLRLPQSARRQDIVQRLRPYLDRYLTRDKQESNRSDGDENFMSQCVLKITTNNFRTIVKRVSAADADSSLELFEDCQLSLKWDNKQGTPTFSSKGESLTVTGKIARKTNSAAITLQDCLEQFQCQEKLAADDLWFCPQCRLFVQATKKFDLWQLPEILVVQLKRFSYSRYRDKLELLVDFPLEGLDLSDYTLGPQEVPPLYDLYAVSNHYGSLGGGHYTAFAKNKQDKRWYNFDDGHVSLVKSPNDIVRSSAAYVLFYRRRPHEPSDRDDVPAPPGHPFQYVASRRERQPRGEEKPDVNGEKEQGVT